jgi:hypothetical protein
MKSHSSSAWMVGPVKEMTGNHSDGAPFTVAFQVWQLVPANAGTCHPDS